MKKSAIALLAVAGLAGAASAQTFVTYDVVGENLTAGGGAGKSVNAAPGDVIRVRVQVLHDTLTYAGGQWDVFGTGLSAGDVGTLGEDGSPLPPPVGPAWEVGRNPLTRIVVSDRPDGATDPGNRTVSAQTDPGLYGADVVISDDQLSAGSTGWFDMGSTPPGLGGLIGTFPIADGDDIFVFDYTYNGGTDTWNGATVDEAFVYTSGQSVSAARVPANFGDDFTVVPTPASVALLGLGGLVAARRRRA